MNTKRRVYIIFIPKSDLTYAHKEKYQLFIIFKLYEFSKIFHLSTTLPIFHNKKFLKKFPICVLFVVHKLN